VKISSWLPWCHMDRSRSNPWGGDALEDHSMPSPVLLLKQCGPDERLDPSSVQPAPPGASAKPCYSYAAWFPRTRITSGAACTESSASSSNF